MGNSRENNDNDSDNSEKQSRSRSRSHSSHQKTKRKRNKSSSNSSSSSDTDSSSQSEEVHRKMKKLKKKIKREEKKAAKKLKKKIKKEKKKAKAAKKKKRSLSREAVLPVEKEVPQASANIPIGLMERSKAMAPMTKEEWDKRQSVVRKVLDEETGRYRLIKGDGEVLEEIVTQKRHKDINKFATQQDGTYFQNIVSKIK